MAPAWRAKKEWEEEMGVGPDKGMLGRQET